MTLAEQEARAEASKDWRQRVAMGILVTVIGIAIASVVLAGIVIWSVTDWK